MSLVPKSTSSIYQDVGEISRLEGACTNKYLGMDSDVISHVNCGPKLDGITGSLSVGSVAIRPGLSMTRLIPIRTLNIVSVVSRI